MKQRRYSEIKKVETLPPDEIPLKAEPVRMLRFRYLKSQYTLAEIEACTTFLEQSLAFLKSTAVELLDTNESGRIEAQEVFDPLFAALVAAGILKPMS